MLYKLLEIIAWKNNITLLGYIWKKFARKNTSTMTEIIPVKIYSKANITKQAGIISFAGENITKTYKLYSTIPLLKINSVFTHLTYQL